MYGEGLGIGRYIAELIAGLEDVDTHHEYVIFLGSSNWDAYTPSSGRFTKVRAPFSWYSFSEQLLFPIKIAQQHIDLMHFPHFNVPLFVPCPFVVTIHDLIMVRHPLSARNAVTTRHPLAYWIKHAAFRFVIARAVRRARRIVTVSETVKAQIREYFRIPEESITVILEAASSLPPCGVGWTAPVRGEYVFTPGNAYPHKNIMTLLRAFKEYTVRCPSSDLALVLCGQNDVFRERMIDAIRENGLETRVVHLGHVSQEDLSCLYRNALALIFPSLDEGFGLPLLEAAECGTPVLASDIAVFHEVLGSDFRAFNPKDIYAIVSAIEWLAAHRDEAGEMAARARVRSAAFTWEQTARQTYGIYSSLL